MSTTAPLRTGLRLRSQIGTTEVIVVRPPAREISLTCGGHPMIDIKAEPEAGLTPDPALMDGSPLGKRFTLADGEAFELLVTKAGEGTLADDGTPLVLKGAKPLPSSD